MVQTQITYKIIVLYFTLIVNAIITSYTYAQEITGSITENLTTELSFEEIQELEFEALETEDTVALDLLTKTHLRKAILEQNNIEKARAYYYKTTLGNTVLALTYADSMITATRYSDHPNYPSLGLALKGHLNYESGNFQEALTNYLEAYNLALMKHNVEQQKEYALAIAAIRNLYGQHDAAIELYNKYLKLLKSENNPGTYFYEDYTLLLFNLSRTHLRLHSLDSARYYVNQGIELALKLDDTTNFQDFILLDAQINYYDGAYQKAKDTLLKYSLSLDGTSKAIKLYYLGKVEESLNNRNKSIQYFKQIDSIVAATNDPFLEVRDVYHQLILHSMNQDDKESEIEYIEKLITYDSLHSAKQGNVINSAIVSYDLPYLKHQKKEAEAQLENKRIVIKGVVILAGIGSFTGMFFFLRSIRMERKLKILLEEATDDKVVIKEKSITNHPSSVPEDVRKDILNKLKKFENSQRFLDKDLDMFSLAQELETNTTYLSIIINTYKGKTYRNYIKGLRVAKAVRMLNADPELLKFSNHGLAEVFGFKTSKSFSEAFYKNTGVYPLKFIMELNSRKIDDHL